MLYLFPVDIGVNDEEKKEEEGDAIEKAKLYRDLFFTANGEADDVIAFLLHWCPL